MFKTNTERSRSSLRTGAGFGVRNEHGALRKSEANTDGSSSQHPRCTPAALLLPLAMFVANKSSFPKEDIELEGEIGYKEAL